MSAPLQRATLTLALFTGAFAAHAQLSLSSAVDLTFKSNPKVQAAQADVDRARASLSESKDAYVPVINVSAGVGTSSGVPLAIPEIFKISGQSLVFNFSQRDYIRSAHAGWDATQLALRQAQDEAAEDAVTTYLALDNAQQRRAAAAEAHDHATRFFQIVQDRFDAGQDPHIEIPRAHRTIAEIDEQLLHIDTEIATLSTHLAHITGLSGNNLQAIHASIPAIPPPAALADMTTGPVPENPGVQAAFANARAKLDAARGDAKYLYLPQVSMGANFSRITTDFSNYGVYYPAFADPALNLSRNALSIGVQFQLPMVDMAHKAKARESAADARHAHFDAITQQNTFLEGRLKLQHSATELELQAEIANDNRDEAQDQLDAVLLQLQPEAANASATPLSPKDEQNARLQIAQRQLDYLTAQLQLTQAEISLYRQNGQLSTWLHSTVAK